MQGLVVTADWDPRPEYPVSEREMALQRAIIGSSVWRHPRWSVSELPLPEITGPNQVLVRTKAAGFCGSDVHMYETDADGYLLLPYRMKLPTAIGHEFSGEIVEVGPEVVRFRVGDAVAVEAMSSCGTCRACLRNLPNLCENGEDLGFTRDGGTAQYVVVDERQCWSLNAIRESVGDQKVYDIGAVIEPTSIAFHAMFLRAGGFRPGDHVAVFGCGPVGLAAVALARACGAGRVIAVDTQKGRRDLAVRMGADTVLDPVDEAGVGERILEITGGAGVGMTVEATGFMKMTLPQIEHSMAYGGKLVIIGMESARVSVDTVALQMRAVEIYSALGHLGGGFPAVIELHRAGRLDMSRMITARFALSDGLVALKRLAEHRVDDAKVLIYPNGSVGADRLSAVDSPI